MKIHHLNCTSMCPHAGKWMPSLFPEEIVCHCLMIESDQELILVDTGLSHETLRHPRSMGLSQRFLNVRAEPAQSALEQVRARGFSEKDVRHIITTHLDEDHCGGIIDFPEAHLHSSRAEMQAARHPTGSLEKRRYQNFMEGPAGRWTLHDFTAGEEWFGFRGVRALGGNPDLLLIPLFGHSRGHFGVAARDESGWMLHAGDAYYDRRELDGQGQESFGMSLLQTLIHSDYALAIRNRQRLRDLRREHPEVRIFCAHDRNEYELFREKV